MPKHDSNNIEFTYKRLQESLWNLEDQVKVFLERIGELEHEVRHIKSLAAEVLRRVSKIEEDSQRK